MIELRINEAIYRNWPMNYGIFISIVKIQMTYGYAHFNDKIVRIDSDRVWHTLYMHARV